MKRLTISTSITQRESGSIERYLSDVAKIPLITQEEELILSKRIKNNDKRALEKLVKANLRFVISVAKQYQNKGLPLGDLITEGNIGLIRAAEKYDSSKGAKFISYAVWWIRQSIINALNNQRVVRLPANYNVTYAEYKRKVEELEQVYHRNPTEKEVASELNINERSITDLVINTKRQYSIDWPVGEETAISMKDYLPATDDLPDEELMKSGMLEQINLLLGDLSKRKLEIIFLFFGLGGMPPHSITDIAERLQISIALVTKEKNSAINQLRAVVKREGILM